MRGAQHTWWLFGLNGEGNKSARFGLLYGCGGWSLGFLGKGAHITMDACAGFKGLV